MIDQTQSFTFGSSQFFMASTEPIVVSTRLKEYLNPSKALVENYVSDIPSSSTPPSSGPLHIDRHNSDSIVQPPPKSVLRKSSYNPNTRPAQHYNIVEDLAQASLAMSALEVLKSCPSQWKALLFSIEGIDPAN